MVLATIVVNVTVPAILPVSCAPPGTTGVRTTVATIVLVVDVSESVTNVKVTVVEVSPEVWVSISDVEDEVVFEATSKGVLVGRVTGDESESGVTVVVILSGGIVVLVGFVIVSMGSVVPGKEILVAADVVVSLSETVIGVAVVIVSMGSVVPGRDMFVKDKVMVLFNAIAVGVKLVIVSIGSVVPGRVTFAKGAVVMVAFDVMELLTVVVVDIVVFSPSEVIALVGSTSVAFVMLDVTVGAARLGSTMSEDVVLVGAALVVLKKPVNVVLRSPGVMVGMVAVLLKTSEVVVALGLPEVIVMTVVLRMIEVDELK